jgi:DNA-binding LacI/PurR family transcriptional regulator
MRFEAVTIKDIAKELGLSTSTVSRALRDSYEISSETKRIVLEYAKKIHYHPNPIALGLKERRTRSIGVVVCEIANSFFSQAINGMESVAYSKGYNVMISQSHESVEREMFDLQYLASRSIDGLLISVSTETKDFSFLHDLKRRGMPIVFYDRVVDEIDTHKVTVDNVTSAFEATKHLIKKGYRNIAHIANSENLSITKERMQGYLKALSSFGITPDEKLIKYCPHGGMLHEEVEEVMNALFKGKNKPDAIFAAADKLTTGALRYLHAKKKRVPEEVALIGFSNSELTELLNPPLTILKQPAFEMGKQAMQLLLEMVESKRPVTDFKHIKLEAELISRGSV